MITWMSVLSFSLQAQWEGINQQLDEEINEKTNWLTAELAQAHKVFSVAGIPESQDACKISVRQ